MKPHQALSQLIGPRINHAAISCPNNMKYSSNDINFNVDAGILRNAFHGAVIDDAERIVAHGGKLYVVPCQWMASLMQYLSRAKDSVQNIPPDSMGKIFMEHLLQPDELEFGASVAPNAVQTQVTAVDERTARRERWTKMKRAKEGKIRKDLKFGIDYTLVGEGLWTLLSSKFGFDISLAFDVEEQENADEDLSMSGNKQEESDPRHSRNISRTSTTKLVRVGNEVVNLPADGKFDYSSLVLEEVAEENDSSSERLTSELVNCSECPDLDDTSRSDKLPVLLLPPSTTVPSAEISLDGMQVDLNNGSAPLSSSDDESGQAIRTRKRKRYGSGLGNLGNTCFMNSTLQCLAHTGPLRSYFLSGEYTKDLNRDNPLGTGGELAIEFAKLLMEMWGTTDTNCESAPAASLYSSRYPSYRKSSWNASTSSSVVYPRDFKHTLGKHAERFMGYNQHDSQELAMYLLDALHEDTNRVSKKPYIEKPEQKENETDEEAAGKAWELHLRRDDSKVLENFMGQIKSKVVCPRETCGRVSTTFEPVMYLSVPLPGTTETTIEVTFVSMSPAESMKKMNITLSKHANIEDLATEVALLINQKKNPSEAVDASNIIVAEVWNKEVLKFYEKTEEVAKINDSDKIFAYEVASVDAIHEEIEKGQDRVTYPTDQDNEEDQKEKFRTSLDLQTITKLNKSWEDVLGGYLTQPLSLQSLLNQRRKTHEDRLSFSKKLANFINRCFSSQEYKAYLSTTCSGIDDTGKMSPTSTMVSKLNATVVDDAQTLEELCQMSVLFKSVSTVQDIQVLEFCRKKFLQATMNMATQMEHESKDGAEIEINFRKPCMSGISDSACGLPIILRVSPKLTVYGLRTILANRLSHVINGTDKEWSQPAIRSEESHYDQNSLSDTNTCNRKSDFLGDYTEQMRIVRQLPLTYEHKSYSYSPYKSGSYRKLGSIAVGQSTTAVSRHMTTFATSNDDSEKEFVLDIVGKQGKVQIHFPSKDSFDDEKWTKHECLAINDGKTERSDISVLDCIHKYCEMEQLDESEMWYCDKCKEHVPAWKHIHLYRTPPILIVHLKRFHYNSINHRRDKIDLMVNFPLKGLDLRDQVMHWNEGEEPIYDCYAVSNHFGGLGGGHYTAFALNDEGEWCNFDDSRVTKNIDESEVVSSAAYLLFYRRQDVKVEDNIWADRPMPSSTNLPSAVSSLDSLSSGRMDTAKDGEVTDEDGGDYIEAETMLTSTPTSTSPMIGSVTDDGDEDLELQ